MDVISNLMLGLSVAALPQNLFYCFAGVMLGTLVGILPGIGPLAAIAMLLPLTFDLPPIGSLMMLAGIYYGSQYSGSTTAILINLPGESSSAVTTIDGYQMARQGKAGSALAAAAIGSFFAGTVATLLIGITAGPLTIVAISFGSAEYFSLMLLGLIFSIALASGSIIKGVGMICVGLLLGLVGTDIYTGVSRFTFDLPQVADGLDFVAIAVGLFGIGEIMRNLETASTEKGVLARISRILPTREELRRIAAPIVRGTFIGSMLGILPGGGALLSSFVAYNVEKRVSKNSAQMGKGAIEGVAAPEAANNAGAQTSFIPMLSLGIPSNPVMALMIGAMTIQGIAPGPGVITSNPELFWGLIASMWIGNAILIVLNLPLNGLWIRLLNIRYGILFPSIVCFCCIGVFSINNLHFSVYTVAAAGVIGYFLVRLRCELAPLVLGFVLGPLMEEHFRRAMLISEGSLTTFVERPISAVLIGMCVVVLVIICLPVVLRRREEVFVEES